MPGFGPDELTPPTPTAPPTTDVRSGQGVGSGRGCCAFRSHRGRGTLPRDGFGRVSDPPGWVAPDVTSDTEKSLAQTRGGGRIRQDVQWSAYSASGLPTHSRDKRSHFSARETVTGTGGLHLTAVAVRFDSPSCLIGQR